MRKKWDKVKQLHSLKLTWPLKMDFPKRELVFQPSIFRCYVSFREGKHVQNHDCTTPGGRPSGGFSVSVCNEDHRSS